MNEMSGSAVLHLSYGVYLVVSIVLTIWVARVLSSSGEVFLIRCFGQDQELAQSTNRLLVIGFYLVNLGFVCFRLSDWQAEEALNLVAAVGSRIGITLLVLGGMHFFNMSMIARMGRTVNRWINEQVIAQEPLVPRP